MCGAETCKAENMLTAERLDMLDQMVLTLYRFIADYQLDGYNQFFKRNLAVV